MSFTLPLLPLALTCMERMEARGRVVCHVCIHPLPSTASTVPPPGLNRTRCTRSLQAKLVVDSLPARDPAVDGNTFLHRYLPATRNHHAHIRAGTTSGKVQGVRPQVLHDTY